MKFVFHENVSQESCHKYSSSTISHHSFLRVSFKFPRRTTIFPLPFALLPLFPRVLHHFVAVPLFPGEHAATKQSRRFSGCRFPWMKRQSQDKVAEYRGRISRLYYARSNQPPLSGDVEARKLEPLRESDATDN